MGSFKGPWYIIQPHIYRVLQKSSFLSSGTDFKKQVQALEALHQLWDSDAGPTVAGGSYETSSFKCRVQSSKEMETNVSQGLGLRVCEVLGWGLPYGGCVSKLWSPVSLAAR